MTNQIVKAIEDGAEKVGKAAGEDFAKSYQKILHETADGAEQSAKTHLEKDAKAAKSMEDLIKGGDKEARGTKRAADESGGGGKRSKIDQALNSGKPGAPAPSSNEAARLAKGRPKLRKGTQFTAYRNGQRASNGEDFVCPNTGKTIPCQRDANGNALKFDERGRPDPNGFTRPAPNPPSQKGVQQNYHFGHQQDSEYHRLKQVVQDHPGQNSWKQILDEYNKPQHWQIEHPDANISHQFESTTPGYGHYQSMAPPPPPAKGG